MDPRAHDVPFAIEEVRSARRAQWGFAHRVGRFRPLRIPMESTSSFCLNELGSSPCDISCWGGRRHNQGLYTLFDRRCRTQTALGKLKKLRQWVNRFTWIGETLKKVFSPHLEKALTFLDDTLLPATSNAVERGNRRHRKMQKRVYRVRSKVC